MINARIIISIIGRLILMEAIFMALSIPVSLIFGEDDALMLGLSTLLTLAGGVTLVLIARKPAKSFGKREGFLVVSSSWFIFSLFGTLPYLLTGSIPGFTNAFFETISGFTTTGASILNDIESLSHGILFWRSMTQWLGGMGIIVLSLAILPMLGIGGIQLFIAEVPGPTKDKLHPRIKETAKRLWAIYLILTSLEFFLLLLGGMGIFDSVCHSLTTMATGGYSTKQASLAAWDSPYIHYVVTIFMFLAGTNFTLVYFTLKGKTGKLWKNEEFRTYVAFLAGFTLFFTLFMTFTRHGSFELNFRESLFQVVSIMTTTGYATADYLTWAPLLVVLLFMLMFFGGSAGSTGGGIKIVRVWLIIKNSYLELRRILHPNAVIPIRYNKKAIPEQVTSNILNFVTLYMMVFIGGVLLMSLIGLDLESALGSVAASLGNIGPGIGSVGPAENFAHIPGIGKWILSLIMLMGRLELFTVLVLFSPGYWKK